MSFAALLSQLADGLAARVGWLTGGLLLLTVGALFFEARLWLEPLHRSARRVRLELFGCVVLGAFARCLWVPALTRHVFDGHEADYFDVWRGVRTGLEVGYRSSEPLRWLYRVAGPAFGGSGQALVVLSLCLSLLAIPLVWSWTRDLGGSDRAGLLAALLVALDPVAVFWASSAYNISLPFVASLATLALLERSLKRSSVGGLLLTLLLWSLAIALREEALLLAPLLVMRLWMAGRGLWRLRTLLPLLLLAIPLLSWPVLLGLRGMGAQTAWPYLLEQLEAQAGMFLYFAPFQRPEVLVVLVVSALLLQWPRVRYPGPLAGVELPGPPVERLSPDSARATTVLVSFVLISTHHLAYALFDDYGFRHTLLPRAALALLFGVGLDALFGRPRLKLVALACLALLVGELSVAVQDVSRRYYADAKAFARDEPRLSTAPPIDAGQLERCAWVAESYHYHGLRPGSHFELLTREGYEKLLERGQGCVLFVYDLENYQASSRAIHDRALKVAARYRLSLLGQDFSPESAHRALVFRVEGPR